MPQDSGLLAAYASSSVPLDDMTRLDEDGSARPLLGESVEMGKTDDQGPTRALSASFFLLGLLKCACVSGFDTSLAETTLFGSAMFSMYTIQPSPSMRRQCLICLPSPSGHHPQCCTRSRARGCAERHHSLCKHLPFACRQAWMALLCARTREIRSTGSQLFLTVLLRNSRESAVATEEQPKLMGRLYSWLLRRLPYH